MSLVYSQALMVGDVVSCGSCHIIICCFEFRIMRFRLVTSKCRYFEFCSLEFSRKIMIFSLRPFETSFENSMTFQRKVARTKDEFRRISFALLLHNTVALPIKD